MKGSENILSVQPKDIHKLLSPSNSNSKNVIILKAPGTVDYVMYYRVPCLRQALLGYIRDDL